MKYSTRNEVISHLGSFKKKLLRLSEQGFYIDATDLSNEYKKLFSELHDVSPEEEKNNIKNIISLIEQFCDANRYKNPHYFYQKYDEMISFHKSLAGE